MNKYVFYNDSKHEIIIRGLALNRLKDRINNTFKASTGYSQVKGSNINRIFNKMEYITWDESEIRVFSFFALEIYELFNILFEEYQDDTYALVAQEIYESTWIRDFESKEKIETPTAALRLFNLKPKPFQLEFIKKYLGLKSAYDLEGYILSFDQGLGKTFTAIALAECLCKEHVYIICPNSIKEIWADEIRKYYKKYNENNSLWRDEVYVSGTNMAKVIKNTTKFFIVNQESIPNIFSYVDSQKNNMIIADESQNFRGINSQRTQDLLNLKKLSQTKDSLLMSGTPIKAIPNEIVPTLRMIDPHFTPELADIYYKAFSDKSTATANIVKERFRRVIYRKLKKDVNIKLPEKYITDLRFKIPHPEKYGVNKINADILKEYHKEYISRLKSGLFTKNKLSPFYRQSSGSYNFFKEKEEFSRVVRKYSRAHPEMTENYIHYIFQDAEDANWDLVNSHNVDKKYFDFLDKYVVPFVPKEDKATVSSKFDGILGWSIAAKSASASAIGKLISEQKNNCFKEIWSYNKDEFIKMINSAKKKTIIFTALVPVANLISKELTMAGIKNIEIVGETPKRMQLINSFKNDDSIRVLVATTQSFGVGLTFTEANQVLFFGTPYRSADMTQALDRTHRIGQDTTVYVYNILLHSNDKNITDRINEILNWSSEMLDALINESIEY